LKSIEILDFLLDLEQSNGTITIAKGNKKIDMWVEEDIEKKEAFGLLDWELNIISSGLNYYITKNTFTGKRKTENLKYLNNIVLDLDYHTANFFEKTTTELCTELEKELLNALKVAPTLIVHSGRGLQLWYCLVQAGIEEMELYKQVEELLIQDVQAIVKQDKYSAYKELQLDLGATRNTAGVMRLVGSYNLEANQQVVKATHFSKQRFTLKALQSIYLDDIELVIEDAEEEIEYFVEEKLNECTEQHNFTEGFLLQEQNRLRVIEALFCSRNREIQDGFRDNYLFLYYNTLVGLETEREQAKQYTHKLNNRLVKSLSDKEIWKIFTYIDAKVYLKYSNKRFIEMLGMTTEEQDLYSFYAVGNKIVKKEYISREEERKSNRTVKKYKENLVLNLYLKGFVGTEIVEECLKVKVSVSVGTVKKIIKSGTEKEIGQRDLEHNINRCKLKNSKLSTREIASKLGISKTTVCKYLK